jgi:radical SAM protein with 4Fe4S-binding SPASM domain
MGLVKPFASSTPKALRHIARSSKIPKKNGQMFASPDGNVRHSDLATIYRTSPIFRDLRDTAMLEGKCGACEYKQICGGSRARAFAITGDPFDEEPCCSYVPKGYVAPAAVPQRPARLQVLQG